jgi:hypothetical protein
MFDWVKRLVGGGNAPSAQDLARDRAMRRKPARRFRPTGPAPLPEVMGEGNSQDDWSEWESSMMELDSQMLDTPESARIYEKEADSRYSQASLTPEQDDVFGSARKNRDI